MTPDGKPGDILLINNPAPWHAVAGVFSALIRARTASDWSHVATLISWSDAAHLKLHAPVLRRHFVDISSNIGEMHVAEAMPSGYIVRPASVYQDVPWRVRTWTEPLTANEWGMGLACIEGFIGTPYDWPGLLAFVRRTSRIGDNDRLFCSEAAKYVAQACGRLLDSDFPARLTPPAWYAECPTPPLKTSAWHIKRPEDWTE